jgi:hypothetical protein
VVLVGKSACSPSIYCSSSYEIDSECNVNGGIHFKYAVPPVVPRQLVTAQRGGLRGLGFS